MASPAHSAIIMKLASTGPNSSDIAAEIVTIRNAKTSKIAYRAPIAFTEKLGSDFLADKESDAINAVVAKKYPFQFYCKLTCFAFFDNGSGYPACGRPIIVPLLMARYVPNSRSHSESAKL